MRSRRKSWRLIAGVSSLPGVFEETLLLHLDGLYGLAMRLTKDADMAADLLQETALRAFQRFHQLRRPEAGRAWLVKILTTTFLNRFARRPEDRAAEAGAETEPTFEDTPEERLLRRCEVEEIEAALAELRDEFRLTVLLADVEEMPLREIAALCDCPVGTVASRLARGRRLLRERLRHLRKAGELEV